MLTPSISAVDNTAGVVHTEPRIGLGGCHFDGAAHVTRRDVGRAQQGDEQRGLIGVVAGQLAERVRGAFAGAEVGLEGNGVLYEVVNFIRGITQCSGPRADFWRELDVRGFGEVVGAWGGRWRRRR
jgi:hypothetical protein